MERIKDAIALAKAARTERKPAPASDLTKYQRRVTPAPDTQPVRTVHLDQKRLERSRIIASDRGDSRVGAIDMLRTRVMQAMNDHGWRTLAITSPSAGDGKTVVSINLAFSAARLVEQTTILVDFDMRKPQIARYLGLAGDYPLADLMDGTVRLADLLVSPGLPRLEILPNTSRVRGSTEFIVSQTVRQLVDDLKMRHEKGPIIFDLPPLLTADDALAFLPLVDCVMLVASANQTKLGDLNECEQKLGDANYLGVVLNKDMHQSVAYY